MGVIMRQCTLLGAMGLVLMWSASAAADEADGAKGTVAEVVNKAGGSVQLDFTFKGKDKPIAGVFLNAPNVKKVDLTMLKDLPKLRALYLGTALWTDKEMEQVGTLTNLQELQLYGTEVTGAGLAQLKGLTKLETLNLPTTVKDDDLKNLKPLTGLLNLELHDNTDVGLEFVKDLPRLQTLRLEGFKITDKGLAHLKGMGELKSLVCFHTEVKGEGVESLKDCPKLENLELTGGAAGGAGLAHLKDLKALKSLNLWASRITDDDTAYLKDLKTLKTLNLWATGISDKALDNIKAMDGLEDLSLMGTGVTDKGVEKLKSMDHLSRLTLFGTKVTDSCVDTLKDMKGLQSVDLQQTKVTNNALKDLAKACPKLGIIPLPKK
jgi:Leucine-rich repeat (LRR) protein